ncbi:cytochrome c oxidase subunit 3 [Carboxydochorda subterranea]|uniref:Cytochrome c oxidase subunit 3 n=1 Tax=Carboxydichorda subterranea TaxID=3109565 RepID=A0ABZ1C0R6_9FIRM|nr:cytochrome c oxidase subunit 3 [Limnochorda sp. L945t]WRP18539.1 cytochrome c oxidase subunit 3 [Limnochorda sp. L945t]
MATVTTTEQQRTEGRASQTPVPGPGDPGSGYPGGPGGPWTPGSGGGASDLVSPGTGAGVFAAWVLSAAVAMLFVGFTATYLARRTSVDWQTGPMPAILYLNTAVLLGSSAALEWGRRLSRAGQARRGAGAVGIAALLGASFVAGQLEAWRQLAGEGVGLAASAHASFFYLLTGMHALHLLAGIAWLLVAWRRTARAARVAASDGDWGRSGEPPDRPGATVEPIETSLGAAAVFWHFLAGLWVYLWVLLFWT